METDDALLSRSDDVIARLVGNHREFLAFLQSRLRDRKEAEDVLQGAFVKAIEKVDTLRDEESAVAWFYRLLRNSIVDRHRKRARDGKQGESDVDELADDPELERAVCRCIDTLSPTIKPEYATILRRVELEEARLTDVAEELAISPNHAAVRLHRARQALKRRLEQSCGTCATHGCLDCTCGAGSCGSSTPTS